MDMKQLITENMDYLRNLEESVQPYVGLFWIVPDYSPGNVDKFKVLSHKHTIKDALLYLGDQLTTTISAYVDGTFHADYWDKVKKDYGVEYEYFPRGRVSYFVKDKKSEIVADPKVKKNKKYLEAVLKEFNIKGDYILDSEAQYKSSSKNV